MPPCPVCQQPASKRDGFDAAGRQRYAGHVCGRDFTAHSASAFAGYRWPAEVILLAVRWSLSHSLSATSVMELLAERGIDVSKRTILRWVQTFGPLLAAEVRRHRRPLGTKCYVDEVFFFRGTDKHYLYRAVDEHGQVVDVLFREHPDTESAAAFFGRRWRAPAGGPPRSSLTTTSLTSERCRRCSRTPSTCAPDCTAPEARPPSQLSAATSSRATGCARHAA